MSRNAKSSPARPLLRNLCEYSGGGGGVGGGVGLGGGGTQAKERSWGAMTGRGLSRMPNQRTWGQVIELARHANIFSSRSASCQGATWVGGRGARVGGGTACFQCAWTGSGSHTFGSSALSECGEVLVYMPVHKDTVLGFAGYGQQASAAASPAACRAEGKARSCLKEHSACQLSNCAVRSAAICASCFLSPSPPPHPLPSLPLPSPPASPAACPPQHVPAAASHCASLWGW
jgi:hypothetical protein